MTETWPFVDRRRAENVDRRRIPRGGRRATDLPHPIACVRCHEWHVRGLWRAPSGARWCECRRCGHRWLPVLTDTPSVA